MHIANPIYDVAFKYLLEDNKVAKLFLSAIIGETITELEFSALERTVEIEQKSKERAPLTVCRFDFSAKVKTDTGFKTIGIELQKAKLQSDVMRFRRYLGLHYQDTANTYNVSKKKTKKNPEGIHEKARQIYCIYFLEYGMDLPARPVLRVNYKVEDAYNGEEFPAKGEFIEGLNHLTWIVQINQLKKNRRNNLEKLLAVFDQSAVTDSRHVLDVDDESFPEEYREIIRRLRKVMEDPKKRREMELEDDIVNELKAMERRAEAAEAKAKNAEAKAKNAEEEAKVKVEAAEAKAKNADAKAKNAEAKAKNAKTEVALKLLRLATPIEHIAISTGLSEQEIKNLNKNLR